MSDFKFPCPKCGQSITCDTSNAGMNVTCPSCNNPITVPSAPPPPPPPPTAAGKLSLKKAEPGHAPVPSAHGTAPQTRFAPGSGNTAAAAPAKKSKALKTTLILVGILAVVAIGWFAIAQPMIQKKQREEQEAKAAADKAEADRKKAEDEARAAEKRNRPVWTLNLADAKIPGKTVAGKVHGDNFAADSVTIQKGSFIIKQDNGPRQIFFGLPLKPGLGIPGQTFEVASTDTNHVPTIYVTWKEDVAKPATTLSFKSGYALHLEFGQPANSKLSGKIFLAVPDTNESFVSGTFEVPWTAPAAPANGQTSPHAGKRPS